MVEPDRDTPGIRAKACAVPTTSASTKEIRLRGFSQPHEKRNQDQRCRNQDDVFTKIILGGMLEKLARNGSGNRRQGQKPQKQAFILALLQGQVRVRTASFGKADDLPSQGRADNLKPGAAEVEQY